MVPSSTSLAQEMSLSLIVFGMSFSLHSATTEQASLRSLARKDSNLHLLVQSQAVCHSPTRHRSGWQGTILRPPGPEPGALPLSYSQLRAFPRDRTEPATLRGSPVPNTEGARTDGGIRTHTGRGLSAVPLPVGLRQRGPRRTRTGRLPLAGR